MLDRALVSHATASRVTHPADHQKRLKRCLLEVFAAQQSADAPCQSYGL
jgi:hypothetical protein